MKPFIAPEPFELKLSFRRDPGEDADVMMAATKRFYGQQKGDGAILYYWWAVVAAAALIGIAMELHRRFVLAYLFGDSVFPSFATAMVYFSPIAFFALALRSALIAYTAQVWRKGIVRRLRAGEIVNVDISRSGIMCTADDTTMVLEWKAIRNMSILDNRINLDAATFVVCIPERAFADRAAFLEGCKTIRRLWRDGVDPARSSG